MTTKQPRYLRREIVRHIATTPAPPNLYAICTWRDKDQDTVRARQILHFETATLELYWRSGSDRPGTDSIRHEDMLEDGWVPEVYAAHLN